MNAGKKREVYWDGLRDALVFGAKNPGKLKGDALDFYNDGYRDGQRAEKRIRARKVATRGSH